MALLSSNTVNMDGSADPGYRYTMPALVVKHEGSSKMKKSVVVNLSEVSKAVGRPAEHLLTYLGQSLNAASRLEKEKAYIAGHCDPKVMQSQVIAFVKRFVMCQHCNNPETSCCLEGSKKNKSMDLLCKGCGKRTGLDSTNKFVKFMLQHPPPDAIQGHAKAAGTASTLALAKVAELADAEQAEANFDESKRKKYKCSNCGHKTSKAVCSKCGTDIVHGSDLREASAEMGYHDCIKHWMKDRESLPFSSDWLDEFDATVKSNDFRSPPLDQLAAVIEVLATDIIAKHDLVTTQLQPISVSEKAASLVGKWSSLIGHLYSKVDDAQASIDAIISALSKAIAGTSSSGSLAEVIMIGFLLSMREHADLIEDKDVLSGCGKLPAQGKATRKFIEFLENNDSEHDEESESE